MNIGGEKAGAGFGITLRGRQTVGTSNDATGRVVYIITLVDMFMLGSCRQRCRIIALTPSSAFSPYHQATIAPAPACAAAGVIGIYWDISMVKRLRTGVCLVWHNSRRGRNMLERVVRTSSLVAQRHAKI